MNAIFTLFSTPYGYLMGILYICTNAIIRCGMKESNKRVLVGMSGGIDSTATLETGTRGVEALHFPIGKLYKAESA